MKTIRVVAAAIFTPKQTGESSARGLSPSFHMRVVSVTGSLPG